MSLLTKGKLFILSGVLVVFYACGNEAKKEVYTENKEVNEVDMLSETIHEYFASIQIWDASTKESIERLGQKIAQLDTTIQFYSLQNDYERGSFIFSSRDINNFKLLIDNSFLKDVEPIHSTTYKVWRRTINGKNILDISIEPHPTLDNLLVVRKRSQE